MAIDNRVMTAALFAEQVVAALGNCKAVDPDYCSPADEVTRALREAKIEYLSHGHYGVVLKIPGTSHVLKVCTSEKDGYPMYAQWAQLNPGPCIPEIYWTCRVSPSLFVCAMPGYLERFSAPDFDNQMRDYNSPLKLQLERVKRRLGSLARDDTHSGNFMYCPVRQEIIITDPFANLYSEQEQAECTATGRSYTPQIRVQQELFADSRPDSADDKLIAAMANIGIAIDRPKRLPTRAFVVSMDFAGMEARVMGRMIARHRNPNLQNILKHPPKLLRMAVPWTSPDAGLPSFNPFAAAPPNFIIPKARPLEFNVRKDNQDVINIRI